MPIEQEDLKDRPEAGDGGQPGNAALPAIPVSFWEELKTIYSEDENLAEYWEAEERDLQEIMPEVCKAIAFNYSLMKPIGVGGGGIVSIVLDRNLGVERALKVSRPSPGKQRLLAKLLMDETSSLQRLSHRNLIQIFAKGAITRNDHICPWYIMDYVKDVSDSEKFLAKEGKSQDDLVQVFEGVISAVHYLHEQGTIHMDIKPGNVLVSPKGVPIISDLGFAKQLRVDNLYTVIGGTEGFIHPEARKFIEELQSDPRRLRGKAPHSVMKEAWDLFSLGKTFLLLLQIFISANPKALSPYARRYLRLLACRLLDGYNTDEERAVGLSLSTIKEIKYESVRQAKTDLDKLIGSYNLEARVPELNLYSQETIQASTLATTPFTRRVRDVVNCPVVMRLGRCTQLGLLNLIYPTATHTRLEHCLGTFSVLCRYLLSLYNDPLNPLFRQIMDEQDLRAALLAALLHDVGQYALAHDIEEADPAGCSHEPIGAAILQGNKELRGLIEDKAIWDTKVDRVLSILAADPSTMKGTLKDRILHSLIDGPMDADKTDYLMRDSLHLGLKYGEILDFEHLLRCLTIVFREDDEQTYAVLGIHEKGKVTAEAIGFARYAMFGQVYWHHTYRGVKAMIHRMVWEMLFMAKGDEARTQLRKEFRAFVTAHTPEKGVQQIDFLRHGETAGRQISQIHEGDLDTLNWIGKRSGPVGAGLYDLISERTLFKRIFVLSKEQALDKELWQQAADFYRTNKRLWKNKLLLQQILQRRIVEIVENPNTLHPLSQAITVDAKNKFLIDGRDMTKAVLLIDFPPEKKASDIPLEFLVEEDRRRFKSDEIKTGSLEKSIIWGAIQNSFHESIAKLRVFCHPDHSEFLSAFLNRKAIESAISNALKEVDREGRDDAGETAIAVV